MDSECICEWNCRCHECVEDRERFEDNRVMKTLVTKGTEEERAISYKQKYEALNKQLENEREKMLWNKNNIIVDLNITLDDVRHEHKKELVELRKQLSASDKKLSESDKRHEVDLADVRILATAEVDDLLKKKIAQFNVEAKKLLQPVAKKART